MKAIFWTSLSFFNSGDPVVLYCRSMLQALNTWLVFETERPLLFFVVAAEPAFLNELARELPVAQPLAGRGGCRSARGRLRAPPARSARRRHGGHPRLASPGRMGVGGAVVLMVQVELAAVLWLPAVSWAWTEKVWLPWLRAE